MNLGFNGGFGGPASETWQQATSGCKHSVSEPFRHALRPRAGKRRLLITARISSFGYRRTNAGEQYRSNVGPGEP